MSLGARATKGGAKTTKESKHNTQEKGKGAEKPPAKDKVKPQATTEQIRMANMIDRKNEDTLDVRRMVVDLMEMTRRSEEEVCSALHDADNNLELACNMLLEESQRIQSEWQTNEKKKKKSGGTAAGNGEVDSALPGARSRSGPRQRRDGVDAGGQRGRGAGRGRGSARGGRAGGRGQPRGRGPRGRSAHDEWPDNNDDGHSYGQSNFNTNNNYVASEDWESDEKFDQPAATAFPVAEDWDNEEWTGSLSDTKVFTPSVDRQAPEASVPQTTIDISQQESWDEPTPSNGPTSESHLNYTYHNSTHQQLNKPPEPVQSTQQVSAGVADLSHNIAQTAQPIGLSGTLSAAQTQYLSQLTQQSQQHETSVYTSNYAVYGSTELSSVQLAQRKPQRARLPPPSKIPQSAVEMPGGDASFGIDIQFGALDDSLHDQPPPTSMHQSSVKQVTSQAEPSPPTHPTHDTSPETNNYSTAANMLTEALSASSAAVSSQSATIDAVSSSATLESRLTASMKQLSTSESDATTPQQYAAYQQQYASQPRTTAQKPQTMGQQQSVYATHQHPVSHHPVYGANVYAPQANTNSTSLTAATAMTSAYPAAVTMSQYHSQSVNSYQTSSSASVYGGSALYTAAAPYTVYQPTSSKLATDKTYEAPRPTTTQPAAKVTTTAKVTSASNVSATPYAVQPQPFYTQQQGQAGAAAAAYAAYAAEEAQMIRGTLPHHMVNNGGYYEMGYGVGGVTTAREPTAGFGLGGGERFGRADASSPQQVAAALPPGYAYYYQAQPTPFQYGVYPYGGGGSNVSGAATGKVPGYSQQQQYDVQPQQDTYKQGAYNAGGKTGGETTAGADLTRAMYAKAHASLNKVNSYEKAAYSGTPPPFGGATAPHHLYIPPPPPQHHVQQQHQESSGGSSRNASGKPATNKSYSQSYWTPN